MNRSELIGYIANRISNCSRHYTAEVAVIPRKYHRRFDGRIISSDARGICIKRYAESYNLPMRAYIFEPDIIRYVVKVARHDRGFAQRLASRELSPDDIEAMVRKLTYGRIKPFMRGRKLVFDSENDVESL